MGSIQGIVVWSAVLEVQGSKNIISDINITERASV